MCVPANLTFLLLDHTWSSVDPALFKNIKTKQKNDLLHMVLKLECHFSIKHELCSFLPWLTSFFPHLTTYPFSSQHQSHFLILLSGNIKLLSFQHNLDIRLKADIILLCQSQMLNRHFTSRSFRMTHHILQWPCWRPSALSLRHFVTDSIWLVFRVQILSHHLLELNAPILFSACDPHVSRHRWSSLS